jgi:opacity protein-like surface antigen
MGSKLSRSGRREKMRETLPHVEAKASPHRGGFSSQSQSNAKSRRDSFLFRVYIRWNGRCHLCVSPSEQPESSGSASSRVSCAPRNFSAVLETGGHTTSNIPRFNTGLSLFYGMGGVRLRVANHTHYQPFGQALFGGVHGFDSYFPAPVGKLPTSYDTSFALTIGGGLDIAVSKHIWIRAVQADYFYSQLRNLQGDRQNQFRIGAGVLCRSPDWNWKH